MDRSLRAHAWIEFDLSESAFISGYVLLQKSQEGFRLLGAEIDTLKIADFDLTLGLLLQGAKGEKKIPDIHAHLHTVGVILAIAGVGGELYVRLRRNSHTGKVYQ